MINSDGFNAMLHNHAFGTQHLAERGSPKSGIVHTPGSHSACRGVCRDCLHHNGAIRTQNLHPGLHVHRKLLVAASTDRPSHQVQASVALTMLQHHPDTWHTRTSVVDTPHPASIMQPPGCQMTAGSAKAEREVPCRCANHSKQAQSG